jgi:hypothetical protein
MINCPSCKLSNLGGTHCTYCKSALPEQENDWGSGASKLDAAGLSAPTELSIPAVLSSPTLVSSPTLTVETGPPPTATTASVSNRSRSSEEDADARRVREEHLAATREFERIRARDTARRSESREEKADRSPARPLEGSLTTYAVLSAFVPGSGQLFKGAAERGFMVLAVIWFLGFMHWEWPMIILWIANVYDAYNSRTDELGSKVRGYIRQFSK